MAFVAFVTLLALALYLTLGAQAGLARGRAGIKAPATTGDPTFERALRIQANTLEQIAFFLPALWLAGHYGSWNWAGALGLLWIAARAYYAWCYRRDPAGRGPGFAAALGVAIVLWLIALIGVIGHLF